jgi:hypothetical protein
VTVISGAARISVFADAINFKFVLEVYNERILAHTVVDRRKKSES